MGNKELQVAVLPQNHEIWQQTFNWQPNLLQQTQFQQLYEQILISNRQLNLTRLTAPDEFWEKHLWDSIRGVKPWLGQSKLEAEAAEVHPFRVIDIGTGAGFPGMPVAIVQPNWQVTLMDSTRKKTGFIETLIELLQLKQVQTLTSRAEQVGHITEYRSTYDLAVIRAVARASVCAEYTLPLLKLGGVAVLYRGLWSEAESAALEQALQELGGKLEAIDAFTTPLTHGIRHCLHIRKIEPTPEKYPRPVGIPTQKPL